MRAVALVDGAPVVVHRREPEPADDEAVIGVVLAGICGTDLEIARGYLGFDGIPGHEFVGVVERSPDPAWTGRRVVGEINASCGTCGRCRAGLARHCAKRTVVGIVGRDGALAERLALPVRNLHAVPDGVPDEAAVFAEPLAAAYEILEQVRVDATTEALVLGAGRLGQLCAGVLHRHGAVTVVGGGHPDKRARLKKLGILTLSVEEASTRSFDLVVDATGSPDGVRRALDVVRPRGTVVVKSTYHGEASLALAGLVVDEITLVGSRCGPFEPALRHLAEDTSIVDGMVSARFALDDVGDAFAHASRPETLKVLLVP